MSENISKVTIQGIKGCFHDAAARGFFALHFPEREVVPVACETFPSMFGALASDPALAGVMAIENTIAGPLLPNHELLRLSNMQIVGEHKMRISHCLCALPGVSIEDVSEVISHPMALMQCEEFLGKHPGIRMTEYFDTAGAARDVARDKIPARAAVCSELAARLYGLDILEHGIETNKRNFTRFLVMADASRTRKYETRGAVPNKASVVFSLPHSQGALSKVLAILSFYELNLTKIQSMPILGKEWEYRFYVDLTFDDPERYRQGIEAVKPLTGGMKELGVYAECTQEV